MANLSSTTVVYDGSALRSHAMDVRDLGPALMSLGQLFDEANRVLNGNKAEVKLQVKAHKAGSFEIILELVQSFPAQMAAFLSGDFVTTANSLIGLIGGGIGGSKGLLWLIKKLKGDKPKKITDLKNGYVRIEIDGDTFEVPIELLRLYQDLSVRHSLSKVLKPLENEGVDTFLLKEEKTDKVLETVDKSSYIYFKTPELGNELIKEYEHDAAFSIISLAFKEDNKWRLFDGNSTISATIKDDDFINRVDRNLVSFSKGDILICKVRISQFKTDSGLKTEYEVLEVKDHKPAARQIPLPIEDGTDNYL